MLTVPEVGRRTYLTLMGALLAAGACAWVVPILAAGRPFGFGAAWTVMTIGLMVPSAAPMVATYTALSRAAAGTVDALSGTAAFVGGYLMAWAAAGTVAYAVEIAPHGVARDASIDAVVISLAAAYELSPLKLRCLAHCRVPLSFVLSSWREGVGGALDMGARYGTRCVGACVPLVAVLFALGPTSLAWMALVAALIATELLAPSKALATRGVAIVLLALAAGRLLAG